MRFILISMMPERFRRRSGGGSLFLRSGTSHFDMLHQRKTIEDAAQTRGEVHRPARRSSAWPHDRSALLARCRSLLSMARSLRALLAGNLFVAKPPRPPLRRVNGSLPGFCRPASSTSSSIDDLGSRDRTRRGGKDRRSATGKK